MPEIIAENSEIFALLQLAGGQWRQNFNGPCGLDFGVLITMAKDLGMRCDRMFYEKLREYERTVLSMIKTTDKEAADAR